MQKLIAGSAIALSVLLASCSHGGAGSTLPPAHTSSSGEQLMQQKMQREQTRVTSSFVAAKHPGFMAETPTMQSWQSGVQEAGRAPVPGGMFSIVNQYNASVNGQRVSVYAGSLKSSGAGIVLVVRRSADLHRTTTYTYAVAPSAVRIQSGSGDQVQLQKLGATAKSIQFRVPM